jgi:pimeloyl-ACP methyl ester carboxylesterase
MAELFTFPDGRNLEYLISGPEDGFPLIWIHGTPSCYKQTPCLPATYESMGIKVITFSRPGYGSSTRKEGRRVIDTVADIQALLAHLNVDKCCVGGWSGGGMPSLLLTFSISELYND